MRLCLSGEAIGWVSGGSWAGLVWIVMYGSLGEIEIGSCDAGWYGINWLVVSLLRTGWVGRWRYKGGDGSECWIGSGFMGY